MALTFFIAAYGGYALRWRDVSAWREIGPFLEREEPSERLRCRGDGVSPADGLGS